MVKLSVKIFSCQYIPAHITYSTDCLFLEFTCITVRSRRLLKRKVISIIKCLYFANCDLWPQYLQVQSKRHHFNPFIMKSDKPFNHNMAPRLLFYSPFVYLMTLSQQHRSCRICREDDFRWRMWKEMVMAHFKVLILHVWRGWEISRKHKPVRAENLTWDLPNVDLDYYLLNREVGYKLFGICSYNSIEQVWCRGLFSGRNRLESRPDYRLAWVFGGFTQFL
jgi:hypothetical protein